MEIDFFKYEDKGELLVIKEFAELKKKNKDYNNIMWFIYFVFDYYSYYSEHSLEDRIEIIEKNLFYEGWYNENKKFLQPLIDKYNELQQTCLRKILITYIELVEKRRIFLETVEFHIDDMKKIDDALLNTPKIIEQEKEIRKKLAEKGDKKIKGAQSLSMLELNKLHINE